MEKKTFQQPEIKVVKLVQTEIICSSEVSAEGRARTEKLIDGGSLFRSMAYDD